MSNLYSWVKLAEEVPKASGLEVFQLKFLVKCPKARGVVKGRLPLWRTILTMVVIIRGGGGHVGDYSLDVS